MTKEEVKSSKVGDFIAEVNEDETIENIYRVSAFNGKYIWTYSSNTRDMKKFSEKELEEPYYDLLRHTI